MSEREGADPFTTPWPGPLWKEGLVLVFLFAIATSINLDKAFHIDDAFHLHAAQWISEHPLRPMSGTIDWSGSVEHYYDGNQPPLFFY